MIALAATLILVAYVLIPGVLFRVIFGLFIPLAKFQKSRTEEVVSGALVATAPLVTSVLLLLSTAWFGSHPFSVGDHPRWPQYQAVMSGLYSVNNFDSQGAFFWDSLTIVVRDQANLLAWFYAALVLETCGIGFLSVKYGSFRRFRPYEWAATRLLLPSISKWHVLLTPFLFADGGKRLMKVDVLAEGDRLYRGVVADYFATREGELVWVFLTKAERFRRNNYLREQERGTNPKSHDYWRPIPGDNLLIGGSKIVNLNLRYELEEPLQLVIERILKEFDKRLRLVSVEPVDDPVSEKPSVEKPTREDR